MLKWISCLMNGIIELQRLGIVHADLEFRNTIQLEEGGRTIYKIIDFDWAFKVRKLKEEEKHLSLFEHTKKIIRFWLISEENLKIKLFRYMFRYHDQIFQAA